jgi:hypothetical protein
MAKNNSNEPGAESASPRLARRPPNTITESELASLDSAGKQRFREGGGTVVGDHHVFDDHKADK